MRNQPLTSVQKLSVRKWFFKDRFAPTTPVDVMKSFRDAKAVKVVHKVFDFLSNPRFKHYLTQQRYSEMCDLLEEKIEKLDDLMDFTKEERETIQKEFGLNSFDPNRRNSKGKLYASLTEELFGRAVVEYNRASKRYALQEDVQFLLSVFYLNMRTPQTRGDDRIDDEEDTCFRQKRARFV
jgi:hypothetical protein